MVELKSNSETYGINIPTKESEINAEVLEKLTSNIVLPKYWCIIALRYRINIFDLVMTAKSTTNKQKQVSVVPILAKYNEGELTVNGNVGDRVLIDGTDIERGSHLNVNTCITPDRIASYISKDEELNKKAIRRELSDEDVSTIFCLEFKIVPVNSIKGLINGTNYDPFRIDIPSK